MSEDSVQVLRNPHHHPQKEKNVEKRDSLFDCKCDEKNCVYGESDDDDIQNLGSLRINTIESITTIYSFLVLDILQAQCHCVNCPLKNLCKFYMPLFRSFLAYLHCNRLFIIA